jgi:hypothetical protein
MNIQHPKNTPNSEALHDISLEDIKGDSKTSAPTSSGHVGPNSFSLAFKEKKQNTDGPFYEVPLDKNKEESTIPSTIPLTSLMVTDADISGSPETYLSRSRSSSVDSSDYRNSFDSDNNHSSQTLSSSSDHTDSQNISVKVTDDNHDPRSRSSSVESDGGRYSFSSDS